MVDDAGILSPETQDRLNTVLAQEEKQTGNQIVVATLQLMTRQMDTILPRATPALVDLRRGQVHRPDAKTRPEVVERWLAAEAMAFTAMWGSAAQVA